MCANEDNPFSFGQTGVTEVAVVDDFCMADYVLIEGKKQIDRHLCKIPYIYIYIYIYIRD